MADPMRVRPVAKDGFTEVRILMQHPMDSGQVRDAAGKPIPAHYITDVTASFGGKTVLQAYWGPAVSKNPFLFFKFKGGNKGETVSVTWKDNKGESRTDTAAIA